MNTKKKTKKGENKNDKRKNKKCSNNSTRRPW